MLNKPVARRIRAKTGTLREVDALTGYIVRDGGRPPMAFSLIVAQGKAAHGDVRARMDQTVMSWAQLADGDDLPPD
jgi:D-alanyl-D-alanine carboxypeptidase